MESDGTRLRERLQAALGDAYALERELGGGGMSRVFVARDARLGRRVVVKVLAPGLAAGLSAQRFEREVQLAARLQHPHVVPLLAAGAVGGLPYFTMPFVEGETLRARLAREGALPVGDAVRLVRELADALSHAHGQGVVHRDLKPENVLLSGGHAVVADFGVAKALAAATQGGTGAAEGTRTALGLAVGTPAYMAPEQAAADPATDHRADLYALGVIAYELLAGGHPFAGRTPQALLAAHLTEIPAPLAERRPDAPPALAALVARLLAKDPADRPPSAAEVLRALDGVAPSGERAAAAAPGARVRKTPRRAAVLGGLAALALASAGGAAWYRARAAPPPAAAAPAVPLAAKRVLVVPLENATGDSTLAPLGRMAADWIAQGLTRTGIVDVAPGPAEPPRGEAGLRGAARVSGASTVVSGAYYLDGDSVRLQARVTDVARWTLLRAVAPVGASRAAPTALLEPLRQRVLAALAVTHDPRFAGWEMGAPPPTYEAYEQMLAGLDVFERGDWAAAIPYYARAAALDTTYAQPLLVMADAYNNLGRPAEADSVVRRLERRREALDPGDRAALDRLRGWLDGDWVGALAAARASVAAAPGAPLMRYLHATTALRAGRPREALAAAAPIASTWGRVRPIWSGSVYWNVVTGAHHTLGAHEAELAAARAARAYHPDATSIRAYELRALAALGRLDTLRRGLAELEAMPATPGAASVPAVLVSVAQELAAHGHDPDARAALRRAIDAAHARPAAQRETPAARYDLARAHYLAGDYEAAGSLFAALAAERPDDPRYLGSQGLVAARRGQRAEAERAAGRLGALRRPFDRGQTTYARAQLAAALGDRPAALTLLRQALNEGVPYGQALHADPELAPLRSDPAFRALLEPRG